jgi:L-ribulokinase
MEVEVSSKYSIGVDFGTESGRAVLVEISSGKEISTSILKYKDGVIDDYLPGTNIKLEPDWALQNPNDWMEVILTTIPKVIKESKIDPLDVIGIGIDFTSCTILPIKKDGTPLCNLPDLKQKPHSWPKLWKHHAAQPEANKLNKLATGMKDGFLSRYGGKISSEWLVPKVMQIVDEDYSVYLAADRILEGGDWIVMQLTGKETRNSCAAGYKALWEKSTGFPDNGFYKLLDKRLDNFVEEKLLKNIDSIGERAGYLNKTIAEKIGLSDKVAVAVGNVDAHVAVPAMTVSKPGKMVMIMGTSICHMVVGKEKKIVEGMCGVVEDGILPGLFGYEAGQSGVGDIFAWFVDNCIPSDYIEESKNRNMDIHGLLEEKASKLRPGESGLLALDWLNGNRSILVDVDLSGMIIGLTLATKPEEIYRALIESTAYGTNIIINAFVKSGVEINELFACGGLTEKNKLLMQIYADVTGREIRISASNQTVALGSAMFGAVAAGKENGGYDSIFDASKKMARLKSEVFRPIPEYQEIYSVLFKEYEKLYNYFGRGENDIMKILKKLKVK